MFLCELELRSEEKKQREEKEQEKEGISRLLNGSSERHILCYCRRAIVMKNV